MDSYSPTGRTQVKRHNDRANYDKAVVHGVIDEALICHVGFVVGAQPVVIPTIHTRIGEWLYFHGALANRMLKTMEKGVDVCVTVTLIDGLIFAKSAFHHSMNYRSAVIFGRAELVSDNEEKTLAMSALVDHVAAGRSEEVRGPNDKELRATLVLKMLIDEVSAKVRTGPPVDDETDADFPVWSGVLPLSIVPGLPEGASTHEPSSVITNWSRPVGAAPEVG